jgi:SAM-dependent methyltransferase
MTSDRPSATPAHFDALYAAHPDPWNLATSPYEAGKYAATIGTLGERRFAAGLEVGCAIGVLTEKLAARCATLLAIDCADAALAAARNRCAGLHHVRFERRTLPGQWPRGQFDLIVLSEILYFWNQADLACAARCTGSGLLPGGLVLLVNWLGPNDGALPGDAAATLFLAGLPASWRRSESIRHAHYRIDVAERA